MLQNDTYYIRLILGFINNSLPEDQVKELYAFIENEPEKYALLMSEPEVIFQIKRQLETNPPEVTPAVDERFQERIKSAMNEAKAAGTGKKSLLVQLTTNWRWVAAAIFIIILGSIATILFNNNKRGNAEIVETTPVKPLPADAPPGRNGAILTLASGAKVLLDSLGNGIVTTQGKTTVLIKNGRLVYDASAKQNEVLYNTITTPKGRQYQLVLPDGSLVWLNAASSITYPTVFAGNDRSVNLTGEAYFEVATLRLPAKGGHARSGQKMPFKVIMANQAEVEVLGTHFNVNAYKDEEAVKTTLLEGKVQVSSMVNGQSSILKPGEQAIVTRDSRLTINDNADVETVMAWKNGRFQFNRTPLPVVMRQLSRWYDMEVEYVKDTPDVVFAGKMGRDLNLSQVLNVLSKMEVNFKVDGKKLKVMPQN
jgi:transmembrane sensor